MSNYESALITGASSGIGAAFARILPVTTKLLLTGRDAAALQSLATELRFEGKTVAILPANLATDQGRQSVIKAAEIAEIDLLINNAGLGWVGDFTSISRDKIKEMVEVNMIAPTLLTHALLPAMRLYLERYPNKRAGIIFTSSVAGFFSLPWFAGYPATKTYLIKFVEALASELKGEKIDVVALCPGLTQTKFHQRAKMPPRLSKGHSAKKVALEGLRALKKRRTIYVVGFLNSIMVKITRLLPGFILKPFLRNWLKGN
ncbi:MAG: SDR family NAD(P)-dependent oxidoreductase [Alphaproteobacteria bacterium]|nr:SDR family NAD(P)-dependent oxidoreductase [Alphaproteobacteria bacterium]